MSQVLNIHQEEDSISHMIIGVEKRCSPAVDQVGCIQVQECQSIPRASHYANNIHKLELKACLTPPRHLLWPQARNQDRTLKLWATYRN